MEREGSIQFTAYGFPRIHIVKLSEKSGSRLQGSPTSRQRVPPWPVLASVCQPNPRLGRCLSHLPESFERESLGSSVNSEKKPSLVAVWNEP